MPWDADPMVLAEPVLVEGEVRGAVATASPTGGLRRQLGKQWLVLLCAGLLALVLAAAAALPLVRWIMRPVQRLDNGLAISFDQMVATVFTGDGCPAGLRRGREPPAA